MRKFSILLLLCTVVFAAETVKFENNWTQHPLFNVVSETPTGVELVFSMHQMVIDERVIDGQTMRTYGVPGIFLQNDEGAPNLTGTGRFVAIPQGAQAQVTVIDTRTEVYHNVEVAPAPNIPLDCDDTPQRYVKNMKIYGRNAYYPDAVVKLSDPMKIRGVDVVIVGVTPFQYNPINKELVVYKDIRVRVDFIGGNGHFGEDRLRNPYWEPILQGHLLNYASLPKVDYYNRPKNRDNVEYIIIVPDDPIFEAWGDTIAAWRKLQGISSEVFNLTEIGGSSANAIESFLNTAYTTWDPAPVAFLILSDYPSSGDVYGITSPVWNSYCVSDNIYADVDGDNLPDMHHGRFTAQTGSHLSIMINKFLSYERNPYTTSHFHNCPLSACGWQTDRWFQLASEVCRGFWINELGKTPSREYNVGSGSPSPGCAWSTNTNTSIVVAYFGQAGLQYIEDTNPYDYAWWNSGSAAGINDAINAGSFMVQHRDHGATYGWSEPNYTLTDLDGLTNTEFTFVNSTNCLTGQYDYSSEVFAEKFHRIQYGALGLNAASEVSYSFVNDTYIWGMFDCLWPQFMPDYPAMDLPGHQDLRPCMAMTYGKIFLAGSSWPYNPQNKNHTYHLFHHHTDVFVTLYSETPQNLAVSHAATLIGGATSFTVTANDSAIIALTVNGEIIGVAEGTGSPIAITIPAQTPGQTMKVTVTKANYYRYEQDVPVVSSSYPYVTMCLDIINDTGGDGVINPGEDVDYGVWAKNVGSGTAISVYGLLSEADPLVTVTADSAWYGNIPQDDSSLSSPYYQFSVSTSAENGHTINFTLEFHDTNDSVFYSYPTLHVYAPILTYQGHAVVGGNGNGILDPGETCDLVATIENEGGAVASSVTSTLMCSSSWITINDASGNYGTIDPGNQANNSSDPYNVTADAATPYGTEADFQIEVTAGSYCDTLDFTLVIGQLVPSDTGYYYSYYSGGPHTQSPVFSWFPIDTTQTLNPGVSLGIEDDDQTVQVTLPFTFRYYGVNYTQISVCSNGWIAMGSQTSTDWSNSGIPNADGPAAMVAGLWDDLYPAYSGYAADIYGYNDVANHRYVVEFFRVPHISYPTTEETFEFLLFDPVYYPTPTGDGEIIVQYLNNMQQTDITYGIENNAETVGIQYYYDGTYHSLAVPITDSFAIKYTTYPPGWFGVEEDQKLTSIPVRTMLSALRPNPTVRTMHISYQVATRSQVSLKIYDATGRLVKTIANGMSEPGYYNVLWNGHDDDGCKAAAGIYFVQFAADDYYKVDKAILLK
jgi:hypothetical protein